MTTHKPEGWHNLTPRLFVHDAAAYLDFLRRAFDAEGAFHGDAPAEIKIGDSILMVGSVGPRPSMPSCFYLYVDDADATYHRALAAGARVIEEPADLPYGDRRAMVEDREGNLWQIATRL